MSQNQFNTTESISIPPSLKKKVFGSSNKRKKKWENDYRVTIKHNSKKSDPSKSISVFDVKGNLNNVNIVVSHINGYIENAQIQTQKSNNNIDNTDSKPKPNETFNQPIPLPINDDPPTNTTINSNTNIITQSTEITNVQPISKPQENVFNNTIDENKQDTSTEPLEINKIDENEDSKDYNNNDNKPENENDNESENIDENDSSFGDIGRIDQAFAAYDSNTDNEANDLNDQIEISKIENENENENKDENANENENENEIENEIENAIESENINDNNNQIKNTDNTNEDEDETNDGIGTLISGAFGLLMPEPLDTPIPTPSQSTTKLLSQSKLEPSQSQSNSNPSVIEEEEEEDEEEESETIISPIIINNVSTNETQDEIMPDSGGIQSSGMESEEFFSPKLYSQNDETDEKDDSKEENANVVVDEFVNPTIRQLESRRSIETETILERDEYLDGTGSLNDDNGKNNKRNGQSSLKKNILALIGVAIIGVVIFGVYTLYKEHADNKEPNGIKKDTKKQ